MVDGGIGILDLLQLKGFDITKRVRLVRVASQDCCKNKTV